MQAAADAAAQVAVDAEEEGRRRQSTPEAATAFKTAGALVKANRL